MTDMNELEKKFCRKAAIILAEFRENDGNIKYVPLAKWQCRGQGSILLGHHAY